MAHTNFKDAFRVGATFVSGGAAVRMVVETITDLNLRTGRIAVCDPFLGTNLPLVQAVPPGSHAVELAVGRAPRERDVVCAARVRFGARPAKSWRMATVKGQKLETLAPGRLFGHGVDSGTSCFVDASEANAAKTQPVRGQLDQAIAAQREASRVWASVELPSGANLVSFTSGFGDGFYASYWGLDAKGAIVELVTDFGVLMEDQELDVIFDRPLEPGGAIEFHDPRLKKHGITLTRRGARGKSFIFEAVSPRRVQCIIETADGRRVPGSSGESEPKKGVYRTVFEPYGTPPDETFLHVNCSLGARPLKARAAKSSAKKAPARKTQKARTSRRATPSRR